MPKTLTTPSGEIVNAVYGFASILLNIIFDQKPNYIAVAFDSRAPTFRHQVFSDYKATRVKAPDELYAQLPPIKEFLSTFPIEIFEIAGYEADDLIASLAKIHETDNKIIIFTGDRDLFQMIDQNITVAIPKTGFKEVTFYDQSQLAKDYHLKPSQIIDYKGLGGDASDNIPGVTGIGPKTAVSLLQKYDSLENIYDHLTQLPTKLQEKLRQGKDSAFFSKNLATLKTDLPLSYNLIEANTKNFHWSKVDDFFQKLHFKSLRNRLQKFLQESKLHLSTSYPQQASLFD